MSENLFCDGQKITNGNYKDGWYRSFKGYPDCFENKNIVKMLRKFTRKGEFGKIFVFFVGKLDLEPEYSYFLIRELRKGNV